MSARIAAGIGRVRQDVGYCLRAWLRKPGSVLLAVLALGLGIGATTAMFSAIDGVLLRPLPYRDSDRLVTLWSVDAGSSLRERASYPDFEDWRRESTTMDLSGWGGFEPVLTGSGTPERLTGVLFVGPLFDLLGVRPALGTMDRLSVAAADEPTVVLSYGIWQRRFGSDPNVVGASVTLNDTPYTVVGVMPAGFRFPVRAGPEVDVWIPLARFNPALASQRGARLIEVIGRLRSGASSRSAQAEMDVIAADLGERYPETNRDIGVELVPAIDEVTAGVSKTLWILFAAAAGLLVIACVNVANLLLVRASKRRSEFSVRAALGAGRGRIALQLLVEGALISVAGGAVGCLLAFGSVEALTSIVPADLPRAEEIAVDKGVLAFAFVVSLSTGVLFSLAPVWYAGRSNLAAALRTTVQTTSEGPNGRRLRDALVVFELALATALLMLAGLLVESFYRLDRSDPGLDASNVLTFSVSLPAGRYPRPAEAFRDIQSRLLRIPGVVAASTGLQLPDRGLPMIDDTSPEIVEIEGEPLGVDERQRTSVLSTQPGYFRAMGIALVRGRDFDAQEIDGTRRVAIINNALARTYFPGEDPIGKRITLDSWTLSGERSAEVVGVSGDVAHRGLKTDVQPFVYLPIEQRPRWTSEMVVRTRSDPLAVVASVREAVSRFDPEQPVFDVRTLEDRISASIAADRFRAYLLTIFSAVAFAMALICLGGILFFVTARRAREIGIRMALGAKPRQVRLRVLIQGMTWVVIGMTIGLVIAFLVARFIGSLLFGVAPSDPQAYVVVSALIALTAAAACWIPARNASRIDSVAVLRSD